MFCVTLAILCMPQPTRAHDIVYIPPPLENFEADPRAAAMGDASSASGEAPLSLLRNPAGIAGLQSPELGAAHVSAGGILHESLAYASPLNEGFAIGGALDLLNVTNANETSLLCDLAAAVRLDFATALGASLKPAAYMPKANPRQVYDMDIALNHSWDGIKGSVLLKNLGNDYNPAVSPYGRQYIAAAALPFEAIVPIELDGELRFSGYEPPQPAFGAEIPFRDGNTTSFLRAGWQSGPDTSPDGRFAIGIGLDYEKSFRADYAVNTGGPFGAVQKFSLSIRFKSDTTQKSALPAAETEDDNPPAQSRPKTLEGLNRRIQELLQRTQNGEQGLMPELMALTEQAAKLQSSQK